MKTYAIINQKGGVGKSTTALCIGEGLKAKGFKVLYVDIDAQGNLSYTLKANTNGYNTFRVLQTPEAIKEEIQHLDGGDILASTPALAGADTSITEVGKEYRLREALELIKSEYDFCIIDTPPALSILTINALTCCDEAIIPAQADIFSLQGIAQLSLTMQTIKKYCNKNLSVLGILITRYNSRSIIRREIAEMLEDTAKSLNTKVFSAKIRECTALVEAHAMRSSIYTYAPKSNATKDYKALVEEILEGLKND